MLLKIIIFLCIFVAICFLTKKKKVTAKAIPTPEKEEECVEEEELGRYYSVTWNLKTGEVKTEKYE